MFRQLCALGCLLGCLTMGHAQDASAEIRKAVAAGDEALQLGQHSDALKKFERALQLAEANLKPNDVSTAVLRQRIARLLISNGDYDRAKDLLNKAIATLGSAPSSNSLKLADALDDLGGLYRRQRVFPEARANY